MSWYDELGDDDVCVPTDLKPHSDANILNELSGIEFSDDGELVLQQSMDQLKNHNGYQCVDCGNDLEKIDEEYMCKSCGKVHQDVHDPIDQSIHEKYQTSHIRMVGPNAHVFQSNLYKSSISNYSMVQKITIERVLKTCRKKYTDRGISPPIPINVCRKAVDLYNEVQQYCIKRSETKNVTIAACIYYAGVEMEFLPTIQDISDFMDLSTKGISKGVNFLISLRAEGKLSFDTNRNVLGSMIKTLFEYVEIKNDQCRMAIIDVIEQMKNNNIGSSLYIETKAKGVTYAILKRSRQKYDLTLLEFCEKCRTRKNTVINIVNLLDKYYDYFKPIYKEHGLRTRRKID
jgi:transcription initiation factor TFIIIB Brf1 subunit/transcription initiation factor TFIIB